MQLVVEQKIKTKSLILIFSPFYSVIKKKKRPSKVAGRKSGGHEEGTERGHQR